MANPIAVPGTNVPTGAGVSPGGAQGLGAAGSITAGNTTTLAPGSPATVTARGTLQDAIFDFGIPQGVQGIQGATGATGNPGVSADAGNVIRAGGDSLLFSPQGFYGADTTNSGTYAITVDSAFKLVAGVHVFAAISNVNTAANPTLNVNGTGAKALVNRAGVALNANEIPPQVIAVVYDGTSWRILTRLTRIYNGSNPANPVIECLGFDAVAVYASFSSATGAGIFISHVAVGTSVFFDVFNGTGAAMPWWFTSTQPTGGNQPTWYIWSNALTGGTAPVRCDNTNTQSMTNGLNMLMTGMMLVGGLYML